METAEKLERLSISAMDEILGKPFKVLDDGVIRVIDYMGSDASIVQAARVSYGKGTKKIHEDRGLIRYLMRHRHSTPLEMCELKLHVRVPMDHWRQWIRHRTANVNEYSTRYSVAIDAIAKTLPGEWRFQDKKNRQGSGDHLDSETGAHLSKREAEFHRIAREVYEERLEKGVAREQARKDLPLSTYTEAYWKIDLHNLFHFLSLRMEKHAQKEIRAYADVVGREVVSRWCPLAWEAFVDYRLEAMTLSRLDIEIIQLIPSFGSSVRLQYEKAIARAASFGWFGSKSNRERIEFEEKLKLLQTPLPWEGCVDELVEAHKQAEAE